MMGTYRGTYVPEQRISKLGSGWSDYSLCLQVDPELFFPITSNAKDDGPVASYTEPRKVCEKCTVTEDCLESALEFEGSTTVRYGMFGGKTPVERWRIARERRLANASIEEAEKEEKKAVRLAKRRASQRAWANEKTFQRQHKKVVA